MSKAGDTRRLTVFIRVTRMPLRVDIEFPDSDLAKCYRQSIEGSKKVLQGESFTVRMELPSSVVDLEMSQSLGGIIMHFDKDYDAKMWVDDVCRPVNGKPKQVYFKQYWSDAEFAKLRSTLDKKRDQAYEEVNARPDRAGPPPEAALYSEKYKPDIFRRGRS
ncbi:hypothetical protein CGLO_05707 [Colletotrichum gloeosporioides Cg-14]|uniref:Uncharacterized protein n=1 Tax=Colletotrichum gloeosporioides (strain Cg-14) TaxID=1237896 RepID=T0M132_COLGC|nr:hypothetical protein CGLO_05707 [Colletotrichum gloeosporioides Cg-14]